MAQSIPLLQHIICTRFQLITIKIFFWVKKCGNPTEISKKGTKIFRFLIKKTKPYPAIKVFIFHMRIKLLYFNCL